MRDIKFRAWNPEMKEMVNDISIEGLSYLRTDRMMHSASAFRMIYDFNKLVWMQFTGLKDKNGKEIYEGDVLLKHFGSDTPKVPVEWSNERAMFIQADGYNEPLHNLNMDYIEVIGNIHQGNF